MCTKDKILNNLTVCKDTRVGRLVGTTLTVGTINGIPSGSGFGTSASAPAGPTDLIPVKTTENTEITVDSAGLATDIKENAVFAVANGTTTQALPVQIDLPPVTTTNQRILFQYTLIVENQQGFNTFIGITGQVDGVQISLESFNSILIEPMVRTLITGTFYDTSSAPGPHTYSLALFAEASVNLEYYTMVLSQQ